MVYKLIKSIFTFAAFLNLFSLSSFACSYADGYLHSTNYNLVKETESILLAEPISKIGDDVDFKIIDVLKGDFGDKVFHGKEVHTSCTDISFDVELGSSLPPLLAQKLKETKPKYLLFIHKYKNRWVISNEATERMNSAVLNTDSELLTTVRQFIRIGSINNYEIEKSELKKLRSLALSGRNTKEYPRSLVSDVDDHLNSPTPEKSYADLRKMYARSSPEKKRDVLWAFAWGKHKEAAAFFMDLLKSPMPSNHLGPISEYITQTKNEALLVKVGQNYPKLGKSSRWPLMWAMIKTADKSHMDLMLAALRSADQEEAGRLATWFLRNPNDEATEIVRKLVGKNYQENWELAISLAGIGDIATIDWASEFMNTADKDRWIAFYVIAYSPLEGADKIAKSVIAGNDPKGLTSLIEGYNESQNPNRFDGLRDIIKADNKDPDVKYWLKRTLEAMTEDGDNQAAELLKLLKN